MFVLQHLQNKHNNKKNLIYKNETILFLKNQTRRIKIYQTYLFKTNWDARSMNNENSFPWHVYPNFAISKASLPKPAPGTKILTSSGFLLSGGNSDNISVIIGS